MRLTFYVWAIVAAASYFLVKFNESLQASNMKHTMDIP